LHGWGLTPRLLGGRTEYRSQEAFPTPDAGSLRGAG
jgi:hypothetical protein